MPHSIRVVLCTITCTLKNRLAIDIGGTFTDVVLEQGKRLFTKKVLTTHDEPATAVLQGVQEALDDANVGADSISLVLHGTTLATNAIIERRGAKTALLTTAGHRDVLAMAYENRCEQYDVNIERPQPLIPRSLRLPIVERVGSDARILKPLDQRSVESAIGILTEEAVESVAIGFLHSYANGLHEETVAEMVAEALPNVALSISSEVCPEIREYERFSTTCTNAYVLPLMAEYLSDLSARLRQVGCTCPFMVMTSSGGLATLETAVRFPIRLVESGPAGGSVLAAWKARELNARQALSFDMGGTTAKICLIDQGEALRSRSFEVDRRYRFKKGSGLPVRIPVIEMIEIGAGGGSIAIVDDLKRIRVGPESAGSEPGPACYGLGGTSATVTDADVVLGRLHEEKFAGGYLQLDPSTSKTVLMKDIATELNVEVEDAAKSVAEVVDENMASAARSHASEWGKSIVGRMLIAFGGAAPLHAVRLMNKLSCDSVLVPAGAGVGSALGFLRTPIAYEVVQSHYMRLSEFEGEIVRDLLNSMEDEAQEVLQNALDLNSVTSDVTALMRYAGQGYEISVSVDVEDLSPTSLMRRFDEAYKHLYGRVLADADIEVISWTLTLSGPVDSTPHLEKSESLYGVEESGETRDLVEIDRTVSAQCVDRDLLRPAQVVTGPALITERHTTTVVPSAYQAEVLRNLDLLIQRQDS